MFKIIKMLIFLLMSVSLQAQYEDYNTVKATINFEDHLRTWDGFGVNYVQTAHTRDYDDFPQEYGGFSLLDENEKDEIIDLFFGEDGLKVNLVKMFLDPLHQKEPGGAYDHETTTQYMMEFVKKGHEKVKQRGADMQIMTTLYGPPAYMTLQKTLRGRDLDPDHKHDLADYMIDWAKYLQDQELPIKYISLHNEGEDWRRWPASGTYANFDHGHDYNMYWRPSEVSDFLAFMPEVMQEKGLEGVSVTNGEPSRWYQFYFSGYAKEIYENKKALENIGLLTSHNFYRSVPPGHRWFAGTSNLGTDLIRKERPDLHAWVTSASWGDMDVDFVWQIYMNIYMAKINGYIPWAAIQRPPHWIGGDPNPGTAITVRENGEYEVNPGYYWYKQVTRAGQPGMAVAYAECMDSELQLMAFAQNDTDNPDAFSIINTGLSFIWRSDALSVDLEDKFYYFATKDPIATRDRDPQVKRNISMSDKGYIVEMAIPLNDIQAESPSMGKELDFNIGAREGAYAMSGEIAWKEEGGKIVLSDQSQVDDEVVEIKKVDVPVQIDGIAENIWNDVQEVDFSEKLHPNTKKWFFGKWKALYDDQNLYLLVNINDVTNMMSFRRVEIDLQGTDYKEFEVYRTSEEGELYESLGVMNAEDGKITYDVPSKSITTFFGVK